MRLDPSDLRKKVFRAARDYHAAVRDFCRAAQRGLDLETPCQVLVGKGVFYYVALSELLSQEDTPRTRQRLVDLRASQIAISRRYSRFKQRDELRVQAG